MKVFTVDRVVMVLLIALAVAAMIYVMPASPHVPMGAGQ